MLLGEVRQKTDRSGWLSLPPAFRPELSGGVVLTRGIEPCLWVLPAGEFRRLAEKVQAHLPLTNRDGRAFARLIFSAAVSCLPDARGRIPLPAELRQYAGIENEVVIVGLSDHLELWNPERWEQVTAQIVAEVEGIAERLSQTVGV
jgi:MraZ protein